MPRMFERVGCFEKFGSITGIYTVLVEGDDLNDPVVDAARAILDGHIVLSREIAYRNHFPAIDVLKSISRVMSDITTPQHRKVAGRMKELMATFRDAEDLINIGAYKKGNNPKIDEALQHIGAINEFLRQSVDDKASYQNTLEMLTRLMS
jgi:flagellum-specific ATP synthase